MDFLYIRFMITEFKIYESFSYQIKDIQNQILKDLEPLILKINSEYNFHKPLFEIDVTDYGKNLDYNEYYFKIKNNSNNDNILMVYNFMNLSHKHYKYHIKDYHTTRNFRIVESLDELELKINLYHLLRTFNFNIANNLYKFKSVDEFIFNEAIKNMTIFKDSFNSGRIPKKYEYILHTKNFDLI